VDAQAVVDQWLPAFLAGRRAEPHLYASQVVVWHNVGEREEQLTQPPSFGRLSDLLPDVRREGVRVTVGDDSFVVQATTVATLPDGTVARVPACLVVHVADGRITRFEEYADSAAAAPILAALSASGQH
jgi:ketosteroid isomerase-like protein